jgi:hypothetical protein
MKKTMITLCIIIAIQGIAVGQPGIPEAVLTDWELLTRDGGMWQSTDNTGEYDAWGMTFEWGLGKKSVDASLYALKEGKNLGALWQFKIYYHPKDQVVIIEQWGSDGSFGTGTITLESDNRSVNVSTVHFPGSPPFSVKHEQKIEGDIKYSNVFVRGKDEEWVKDKTYEWKRIR